MNFGEAFSFVFKDPNWFKKIIIPVLCGLIPVIGQFVLLGYMIRTAKNVIDGVELPLPTLDFGQDLGKGFNAFLINLVYALPIIVLGGIAGLSSNFLYDANEALTIVLYILMACFGLFAVLYGIIMMLIIPIATANYAAKGNLGAAFKFKELFAMLKHSFGAWLLVILGSIIGGFIAPLGSIACGIGVLLTSAYGMLIYYHLMGQAYKVSNAPKVGETVLETL